ncbi:LysR family transcriptional regulator [Marinomonas pollencensis]|uniref:DNA-binding transcriptional LysR family regulator n=1 Tax=Marinomonas pollencensis TaxID=491954 RepID=A0A3E0DJL0_9GAMM|nr:LysR family transcriptional regulator [Marinomonas pollencensis]REG82250.1 DNA-binding transcriptional LysR family regulator [Marinomonas pollencensis]
MLPPLKALPVFESVARLNSFSLAAAELNVSQSAISHQIRALEDYLGESLFQRQGRYLTLTQEGKNYLDVISSSLSHIARASNQIRGQEDTKIRIAVYSSFAVCWLMPRLSDLQHKHPNLDITIAMTHGSPELSDKTADCFITTDQGKRGFESTHLYQETLFPVCSHAFYEQMKNTLNLSSDDLSKQLKSSPELLQKFPLITSNGIYNDYTEDWLNWFTERNLTPPNNIKFHKFSHLLLAYEAAKHSLGIALVNDYMFSDKDSNNSLIRVPTYGIHTNEHFFFSYKTSRRNETAIKAIKHWIVNEASSLKTHT